MVAKKPKYEPIGDTLSCETAWVQAAHALDLAGEFAVESRDVQQLNQIAAAYIELGSRLNGGEEAEEEEEIHDLSQPAGFVPVEKPEPVKEAAEEHGRTYRNTKARTPGKR